MFEILAKKEDLSERELKERGQKRAFMVCAYVSMTQSCGVRRHYKRGHWQPLDLKDFDKISFIIFTG